MASDGTVKIDTDLDSSGLENGLSKAKGAMSSLGGGAVSLAKTGFNVLAGAITATSAALAAGAVAGVKYNSTMETYTTSFEVMTGSAEKAVEVTKKLQALGAATPFEMTDLAETTQLLMNYGMTADDAMGRMMMLGDISQGSADKMNRIAMAYGQMSSAGKVQLEDVKQMIEAGFNPLQEISQSTGESMASLYKRISDGKVSVDEITAAMQRSTSAGGKYFQSMEKQSQTFNGQLSTLKDNANQLLGSLTDGIQKELSGSLMPQAIAAVGKLSDAYATGGTDGLISAGTKIITDVITGVATALPNIITTAVSIINQLITGLRDNESALGQAGMNILTALIGGIGSILMNLGPLAVDIISGLLTALTDLSANVSTGGVDMLNTFINGIVGALTELAPLALNLITTLSQGIADALPALVPRALELVADLAIWILDNLPMIIDAGLKLLVGLAQGLVNAIPMLIEKVPEILGKLVMAIVESIPMIVRAGQDITKNLALGLIEAIPHIQEKCSEIVRDIWDKFTNINWGELGSNILAGIGNGFKESAGDLANAAADAVGGVVDNIKNFFGIHSPSTLMRDQIGKFLPAGIGVGFEAAMPAMTSDVISQMNGLVSSIQGEAAGIGASLGNESSVVSNVYNSTSSNGKGSADVYNFKGMNEGATFVVREESDIDKVSTAIQKKTVEASRGKGIK